jgi:U4/U6 small nuclear ribonucleoprotein PRP3
MYQVHGVQVFRVLRLDDGRNQYKVEINATENRLTGVCIVNANGINLVVAEGDPKGIRRFNRLMLHRIDWNPMLNMDEADEEMFEQEVNKCHLVWQGTVAQSAFEDFKKHKVESTVEGRAVLAAQGVAQYWDAAQTFVADG